MREARKDIFLIWIGIYTGALIVNWKYFHFHGVDFPQASPVLVIMKY